VKNRNENEIKKYNTVLSVDPRTSKLVLEGSSTALFSHLFHNINNINLNNDTPEDSSIHQNESGQLNNTILVSYNYKKALIELFGIVIFGLPAIFALVYAIILLYKCLCSKNYEEWRRSWTTSSIKRQYKIVHRSQPNNRRKKRQSDDEDDDRGNRANSSTASSSTEDEDEDDEESSEIDEIAKSKSDRAKKKQSDCENNGRNFDKIFCF